MRFILLLAVSIIFLAGCYTNPRYRTGKAKKPDSENQFPDNRSLRSNKNNGYSSLTTIELLELGRIIQSYLGTPYGCNSADEVYLDCSRFTMMIFDKFNGTKLPRTTEKQFKTGKKVNRNNLRYSDLVFFVTNGSTVSHVGIYIGYAEFVHSSLSSGIIISNLKEKYWRKRFAGGRRILP